jgi:hypothetical protein
LLLSALCFKLNQACIGNVGFEGVVFTAGIAVCGRGTLSWAEAALKVFAELSCDVRLTWVCFSILTVVFILTFIELVDELSDRVADWLEIRDAIKVLSGCLCSRGCCGVVITLLADTFIGALLPSSEGTDASASRAILTVLSASST